MVDPQTLYPVSDGGQSEPGGGGSGGGTVEISMKDYVDAQDEKTRAQNDARFSEVLSGLREFNTSLDAAKGTLLTEIATTRDAAIEAKNARWMVAVTAIATALSVIAVMLAIYAIGNQVVEMLTSLVK